MLPLLLTRLYLLVDLFLSVWTSVSGRVSVVCHPPLSSARRRGRASLHGTSYPSDWNQIDRPYQFTLQEEVPGWRGGSCKISGSCEFTIKQPLTSQKASWYGLCSWHRGVFFYFHTQTRTHPRSCSSLVNHIHLYTSVSDTTAPLSCVKATGLDCWKWTWNTCRL